MISFQTIRLALSEPELRRHLALDIAQRCSAPIARASTVGIAILLWFAGPRPVFIRWLCWASRVGRGNLACRIASGLGGELDRYALDTLLARPGSGNWYQRCLILCPPLIDETGLASRGVLLIKFTETVGLSGVECDLPLLAEFFDVVLEPSWAGYCVEELLVWRRFPGVLVIQATDPDDRVVVERLFPRAVCIAIGASNWVDYRCFHPTGADELYGSVYVANLTPGKRVYRFFETVVQLRQWYPAYRAALVVSSWGGEEGKAFVERLLEGYSLRGAVDVFVDLDQDGVNTVLNQSRVCVLLSRKEGSNKSLFESMFAGTPGLLLSENIGVAKEFIPPVAGVVVPERRLIDTLQGIQNGTLLQNCDSREWAVSRLAPEISAQAVAEAVKYGRRVLLEREGKHGKAEDVIVAPKVNSPEATYLRPSDNWMYLLRDQLLPLFLEASDLTVAKRRLQLHTLVQDASRHSG